MENTSYETDYFKRHINDAMELMQKVGHITDYEDLSEDDNSRGIELMLRLNEAVGWRTESQWIEEGVSLGELEKCQHFLKWQIKLDPDWEDYE